jgi:hypothetical protein
VSCSRQPAKRFDLAQFGDRCGNLSQFGVPILDEFGKVDLQVVQLREAGLGMSGAGDPLGQLATSAEWFDRSLLEF